MMQQKIIDFHTHPYLSMDENLCMYKEDFYLSPKEALEDLKNAGISHICGSVLEKNGYTQEKGFLHIRKLNEKALKLQELYGDFYTPGFHIHPAFVRESLDEIERMHQKGIRLIGELVPYMHGWAEAGLDYASGELHEILNLAGEYNMVVSYHTMTEQQEQMDRMIAENPRVTFVAAHPGQKADYCKQLERLKKYENVYLDISGTGLFRYGMLAAGIKAVGSERILFGTDYPITNPGMYVQAVLYEHISDSDRDKIFYENAQRLLGLNDKELQNG